MYMYTQRQTSQSSLEHLLHLQMSARTTYRSVKEGKEQLAAEDARLEATPTSRVVVKVQVLCEQAASLTRKNLSM